MFDWGFYAFTMRLAYRDRLQEAEQLRLARQARAGQTRPPRWLAWVRAWLERGLLAPVAEWPAHVHSAVQEAATDSSASGGLIL
jgi:hypothetical protein